MMSLFLSLSARRLCFCGIILLYVFQSVESAAIAIPGTTTTDSGYDSESGRDAICWKSQSASGGIPMPNPLIASYVVSVDGVQILRACPTGNNVSAVGPVESEVYGQRLRTGVEYFYTVNLVVNMTSLNAESFTSDRGPGLVSVQILACRTVMVGFCSPFVHEAANKRLADEAAAWQAAHPNQTAPQQKFVRGMLHGGSHIHSGFVDVRLPPEKGPIYNVSAKVSFITLVAGDYFPIAQAELYLWDNAADGVLPKLYRYDMANAVSGRSRITTFQDPPLILTVPDGVADFSYCLIAIAGSLISFLIYQTIKYRTHHVMKLSQANFLIVFLFAALVATSTIFLMEPNNDAYCRISLPITFISLQTIYAVMIGRLWRINALISPLLLKSLERQDTLWSRFTKLIQRLKESCVGVKEISPRRLRNTVSDKQLALVVILLVTPQFIIQILALILQPRYRAVDFNSDQSIGREICRTSTPLQIYESLINYGYFLFAVQLVLLMLVALQSKKLPSLFNESKRIFDSALLSSITIIMGVAIITITQQPTTSPAVAYMVWVFVVLTITFTMPILIVLPKLSMIWRGEKVVVSQLVLDHARDTRKSMVSKISSSDHDEDGFRNVHIYDKSSFAESKKSGFVPRGSTYNSDHEDSATFIPKEQPLPRMNLNGTVGDIYRNREDVDPDNLEDPIPKPDIHSKPKTETQKTVTIALNDDKRAGSDNSSDKKHKRKGDIILIQENQAPARKLVLKMVELQEQLIRMNQRIMTGMAVGPEDWEKLRGLTKRVGNIFQNKVEFSWEATILEEGENEISSESMLQAESVDLD